MQNRAFLNILTGLLLGCFCNSFARAEFPLKDPKGLPAPVKQEEVFRVKTAARVVLYYGLIRTDFPHLRNSSNEEINDWFDRQIIISKAQSGQTEFNSP